VNKYRAVIASLNMDSIEATLTKTAIDVIIYTKKNDIKEKSSYPYSDIKSINIFPIDVDRYQINIKVKLGKTIKLVSRTFGEINDKGNLIRANIDQLPLFNEWVNTLHENLINAGLEEQVQFYTGSNAKVILLGFLLAVCVIAAFLALSMGKYGTLFTMISGVVLVGGLLFKLGAKKFYNPNDIPEPYKT
jgi:hypothetical protein